MAGGTLAGAYRCNAHERHFTYDVVWNEGDGRVSWSGRVAHGQRMVEAGGDFAAVDPAGTAGAVKRAVEAWIEQFSCDNAP